MKTLSEKIAPEVPSPCYGETPLVDPSSGVEFNCGASLFNRIDCPADSYCHQTAQFAKCCPKSMCPMSGSNSPRRKKVVGPFVLAELFPQFMSAPYTL